MLFGSGPWFLMYIWLVGGVVFAFFLTARYFSMGHLHHAKASSQLLDTLGRDPGWIQCLCEEVDVNLLKQLVLNATSLLPRSQMVSLFYSIHNYGWRVGIEKDWLDEHVRLGLPGLPLKCSSRERRAEVNMVGAPLVLQRGCWGCFFFQQV